MIACVGELTARVLARGAGLVKTLRGGAG